MFIVTKLFLKLKLIFPDPIEEKEFATLKAPLIKSSLTWLFVFVALLFVPLTFRYFDKNLSPQNYLGIAFIVCAALIFLLHRKLSKWLELLSLLYVALMIIFYIINMRLILRKQAPYEAFYMGYGFALIQRMLDYRIGNFLVIVVFHIVFTILKFTLVAIPDAALAGLVVCLETFPIILGFKAERADRVLFDSVYNSKNQLIKFKNFLTECLPSQIVVLDQNYSDIYFSNNPFNETFQCKNINQIKSSFQELIIEKSNFEKNPLLAELIPWDKDQPLTLSQMVEFVANKKEVLHGLKSIKLQAIQQTTEIIGSSRSQFCFPTRTKETLIKEEDFIPLKREKLSHQDIYTHNRNLTSQIDSSVELEHVQGNTYRREQKEFSTHKRVWNFCVFPITWDKNDGIAIVLDDVTYEKTITDLQVADRNKKDLIIALISHELKTPLNSILGMLDIVKKRLKNVETIKQTDVFYNLDACRNSGLLLLNLINSIVDFSKIKTDVLKLMHSKVNVIDMLKKIKPVFQQFCQAKNLYLKIEADSNLPKTIVTDENRLTQILIYLLGNAFKFTFKGGVTLKAELESRKPRRIRFSVKDTGVGISNRDKEKLFKLFGVAEQKDTVINTHGMGLGLTISNTLARMLNSEQDKGIQVDSELDKGSTFSFLVQDQNTSNLNSPKSDERDWTEISSFGTTEEQRDPISVRDKMLVYSELKEKTDFTTAQPLLIAKNFTSGIDERESRQETARKPWCLLVDDNPFNLMVAHNMMEERGYNIKTAMNGKEAIEKAQEHQTANMAFEIILMDCQMPVMNGYESTKALKKMMSEGQIKECPIVALTANARDAKHDRLSEEAGMSGFIPKPLQMVELQKVLSGVHKSSFQEIRSPDEQKNNNSV